MQDTHYFWPGDAARRPAAVLRLRTAGRAWDGRFGGRCRYRAADGRRFIARPARTGFGAVLLLTALGVPGKTVVDDYLATNRIWRREHALPPETPDAVHDALLTALRPLLEDGLGLHPARLRALRGAMLE